MLNLTLDLIWGDGVNLSTNLLEKQSLKGSPIQGRGNRARSVIEERTTTSKSAPIIQREENLALIKPMLNLTACPKLRDEVIYKSEQKNKQKSQPDGAEIKQAQRKNESRIEGFVSAESTTTSESAPILLQSKPSLRSKPTLILTLDQTGRWSSLPRGRSDWGSKSHRLSSLQTPSGQRREYQASECRQSLWRDYTKEILQPH